MKRLAILGASGHGKVVADTAELCGWDDVVFFDDAWPDLNSNGCWSVIGDTQSLIQNRESFHGAVVAIGNNALRLAKLEQLQAAKIPLVSIFHPNSVISQYANIKLGSVVFAGAVINVDVMIGKGAIINTSATIDHDCVLGDAVHISPGANLAGNVHVGSLSWIGIAATVKQGITISENVVVGAGSAVISNVKTGVKVVGVPAKIKK